MTTLTVHEVKDRRFLADFEGEAPGRVEVHIAAGSPPAWAVAVLRELANKLAAEMER